MQYQMLEINIQDIRYRNLWTVKYQIRIIGYVGEMADNLSLYQDTCIHIHIYNIHMYHYIQLQTILNLGRI